ncbi:hypothetical protein BsWGS_14159 [Bradybaena similaris]
MAAFTENAVKLAGLAAALPFVAVAAGYRLRFIQGKDSSDSGVRRVYRVSELPVYSAADMGELKCGADAGTPYPINSIEAGIGIARKTMQNFFGKFAQVAENTVKMTTRTTVTTSEATYRFLRDNTEDFSRAALIVAAGIGGSFIGHKRPPWRRLVYGLSAAVPCVVLCYPSKLMQLGQSFGDVVKDTSETSLWNHVTNKHNQGEQTQLCKMTVLHTSEDFDTISVSDFCDPEIEKIVIPDLCCADTIEKPSTVDLLCCSDSAEQVGTSADNTDQLNIGDLCTAAEHMETLGTGDFSNAEKIEDLDKVELLHAENINKPKMVDSGDAENISKSKTVDSGDAENIKKLDTADLLHAENISKPSTVDDCNAENVKKLGTVNRNAENGKKLGTVNRNAENKQKNQIAGYSHVKKPEKKQGKGRTDQSNPEDKDMYSTRSS